MRAGVATAILTHCSLSGKVRGNALVLEVDELNGSVICFHSCR